ncbi:MAG: type restriction enzyme subunit [Thermococcaceae archaeon]|nr:type restriction enzyme subunit [Thermococcaceae archaeon]
MVKFKWETEFKKTEIGEIPKDWEVKVLGQLIKKITKGKVPKKPKKTSKNIEDFLPYLSVEFLRGEKKEAEYFPRSWGIPVTEEDILIIWDGAANGEILKGKKGLLSSTVALIEPNDKVIKKYLFFFLKFFENELKKLRSGTDDRHVDKQALLDFLVTCPPLEEQHRIATILSWFDDLIENKRRQNEILENMAMAIFKSWFIDFEPFQDEEFVYSEELDMEIPKGWEVKPIGEIAEITKGISYKSDEISDTKETKEYVVFITLKCFKRGGGFRPEYKYYLPTAKSRTKNVSVTDGDLIIGITDMTPDAKVVGAPALVVIPPWENSGMISLDCAKIQTDSYLKEYLYLFLKLTQQENSTFANGVNVLHLNTKLFEQSKYVLLPPKPILDRFHSLVEPLFKKIILNEKEIMLLKKARDTLLPQLVFGRLRVVEI